MYLHKAGTVILAASIILYICNTYPEKDSSLFKQDYAAEIAKVEAANQLTPAQIAVAETLPGLNAKMKASLAEKKQLSLEMLESIDSKKLNTAQAAVVAQAQGAHDKVNALKNARKAELMAWTISGRIGHLLEPFMRPIGFDWHVTTATIGALAAKEVFVSQLGILFAQGDAEGNSQKLRDILVKTYTPLQGFCMMLFCLLSIPCLATLAVVRRELNSWKMAFIEGGAMFALAYAATFIVYQMGTLLNIGTKMLG